MLLVNKTGFTLDIKLSTMIQYNFILFASLGSSFKERRTYTVHIESLDKHMYIYRTIHCQGNVDWLVKWCDKNLLIINTEDRGNHTYM